MNNVNENTEPNNTDKKLIISDVSESLLFGDLEITKMEESGDFMIILKQYDGDAYNYLTAENAQQIITFLQKQLNSH